MISYIIIDDEPIAHRIIEGYCQELSHMKKIGNFFNAMEAMEVLNQKKADLVFLDIKMPNMSGFELLRTITHPPKVIVTTAFKKHALEGYELDIVDYLLKPFSFERFVKAVNKVQLIQNNVTTESNSLVERIAIKGDKIQHIVDLDDILYIEAYGNYCKVHVKDKTIVTPEKISTFEALLDETLFMRVHKSFIVAKNKIQSLQVNRISIGETKIPIGQTYRLAVTQWVDKNLGLV